MTHSTQINSPIGILTLYASKQGITAIQFGDQPHTNNPNTILKEATQQLVEYFGGIRTEFSVAIDINGTDFQLKTWDMLNQIGYGHTKTYHELATLIGHPKASRAIGNACRLNPIPFIIPCHRILGKNGLGGYLGGLETKQYLLNLESKKLRLAV